MNKVNPKVFRMAARHLQQRADYDDPVGCCGAIVNIAETGSDMDNADSLFQQYFRPLGDCPAYWWGSPWGPKGHANLTARILALLFMEQIAKDLHKEGAQ